MHLPICARTTRVGPHSWRSKAQSPAGRPEVDLVGLQERPDGKQWQQPEFLSLQQLFDYSGRICSERFPMRNTDFPWECVG